MLFMSASDTKARWGSLGRLDANLLVALDALLRERNVTRAARHNGISQSAMSHTLKKLRELFEDPLLVRTGREMSLTPRAEALELPLRAALDALARAVAEPEAFDPQTARRTFRIAAPDLAEMFFAPELQARLQAIGADLRIVMLRGGADPRREHEALMTGELDLLLAPRMLGGEAFEAEMPAQGFARRSLLHDDWSGFVRRGHPGLGARGKLGLKAYLSGRHVMVSPTGTGPGPVDLLLAESGRRREVALRVTHFASAPLAVADSDLILTAPSSLSRLVGHLKLACFPVPVPLAAHSIDAVWHERFHADAGHRWLRELLAELGQGFGTKRRRARGR